MFAAALIVTATVTNAPLSAVVIFPICLYPRRLTILSGLWTVVMPVSLIFQMLEGPNFNRFKTVVKLLKNTLVTLKLVARARLVALTVLDD